MNSIQQSQQAKKKTLAEWRAARLRNVDLPSGLTVTVRDVGISDLVLSGRVPNTLMSVFVQATEGSEAEAEKMAGEAITKNADDFAKMLDAMVTACLVEPRISDKPGDDCITLAEMPMGDKLFLFNEMNREAAAVRSFREGERKPDHSA